MIAAFFTGLWGRIWPWVAGAGAAVVAALAIRQSGKSAGRQEARIDQLEADRAAVEESREAAAEIDRLDDDGVRDRARQRMHGSGRR